jgi:DnaA family protein
MAKQRALQFELPGEKKFEHFLPAANTEILDHLQRFVTEQNELQIYLWGESGQGKSHLLQACCHLAHQHNKNAFYLDLATTTSHPADILEGLESVELVCLDHLDCIVGVTDWEQALFDFYNRQRDTEHQLLMAAQTPPRYLPVNLPDLKTRMSWGLTLKLKPLSDQQMIEALRLKARTLGFDISDRAGQFLRHHYQRDPAGLWQLLDKIAQTTLVEKRKLSMAMLKRIIEQQDES